MDGGAMNLSYDRPYFNLSVAACRRAGASGGRRSTQNRRLCQKSQARPAISEIPMETAAEAIARLDAQFPWLRGAERRRAR